MTWKQLNEMKTKQKIKGIEKLIDKEDFYYVSVDITTANFPVPKKIETKGWKLIKMDKSFTSQEALDEIRKQACRPANIYELALWQKEHREKEMLKGKWMTVLAFAEPRPLIGGGYRRVPYVDAVSGGGFGFDLGNFVHGWSGDFCLLCFCDSTSNLGHSETQTLESLTLETRVKRLEDTFNMLQDVFKNR